MTLSFRQLVQRLAVLSLIACLAFSFGSLAPGAAVAQDLTAPDENDASDQDSSDGADDTADLTNETSDDGDSDTADLTNETSDDGDTDTQDLTNETSDDPDGADDGATDDVADDGDADGAVEELPSTGQGSSQQSRGLELTILATVLLAVAGAFFWTRRQQRA